MHELFSAISFGPILRINILVYLLYKDIAHIVIFKLISPTIVHHILVSAVDDIYLIIWTDLIIVD